MNRGPDEDRVVVEQLGYTYLGRNRPTICDISCEIAPGAITLLSGKTGSGKSTFLRALAGLIPNQSRGEMTGRVRLFDLDTRDAAPANLAQRAGLVLQSPDDQICATTVVGEVAFGLENLALPPEEIGLWVDHWLQRFGLAERRGQSTKSLSGGQKQRLMLASILAMRPRLLLFDEPFARLDAFGAAEFLAELLRLRAAGLAVVVAEHRLEELAPIADVRLTIEQGRLRQFPTAPCLGAEQTAAERPPSNQAPASAPNNMIPPDSSAHLRAPLEKFVERTSVPDPAETLLRVRSLSYRYRAAASAIWSGVSFDICAGECVALVGPNGSGKTTLLDAMVTDSGARSGTIDCPPAPAGAIPLGLTPQNPDLTLICRTVREELAFGPRRLRLPFDAQARRAAQVAFALGIEELMDEAPLALSQGQRLLVAVAAAATAAPRLLLLDEPTTGQDPAQVARLLSACRCGIAGVVGAVLFSSHDAKQVANFATRTLVLAEGRLLADCTPAELFADADLLARSGLRVTGRERADNIVPETRRENPSA